MTSGGFTLLTERRAHQIVGVLSCRDRVLIFGTPAEDLLPRGDDLEAILMGAVDYSEKPLAHVDCCGSSVSSEMMDRVTAKLGRKLYEAPMGFK